MQPLGLGTAQGMDVDGDEGGSGDGGQAAVEGIAAARQRYPGDPALILRRGAADLNPDKKGLVAGLGCNHTGPPGPFCMYSVYNTGGMISASTISCDGSCMA